MLALPNGVATADVSDDPKVQEAEEEAERARAAAKAEEERLEEERQLMEVLSADLDEAAAAYDHADAHHQRLLDEATGTQRKVAAAQGASESARESFADTVAAFYKQAPLELRLSDMVLDADSPATAMHRIALLGRMSAGGVGRLTDARMLSERTTDEARQQEVVTVGTEGAAALLRERSDHLGIAVSSAQQRVEAANADLESARLAISEADAEVESQVEAAKRRRAEEERQRREAARLERIAASDLEDKGYALPPVDGLVCPIGAPHGFSASFGAPRPNGRSHQGIDMFAVHGMPLYAVTDGTVRVSSNRLGGLVVYLDADNGDYFYYAHLSAVSVSAGQRVEAGDILGANGNTGNARATPPHLHWQYHPGGGNPVDPYPLARTLCR